MYTNKITLSTPILFEWDKGNTNKNRLKHGVSTDECEEVFFNSPFLDKDIKHSVEESRSKVLGHTNNGRKLFVVFTLRSEKVRVISARDQNKKEKSLKLLGGDLK